MSRFSMSGPRLLLFAAAGALLAAGCGTGSSGTASAPVRGQVAVKGVPTARLEGAKVWLRSTADPTKESVGSIDHDGTFAVATVQPDGSAADGAPPGDYAVRLDPPGDGRGLPFHAKYKDYRTSGLRVTVPAAADLTLELDRPGR